MFSRERPPYAVMVETYEGIARYLTDRQPPRAPNLDNWDAFCQLYLNGTYAQEDLVFWRGKYPSMLFDDFQEEGAQVLVPVFKGWNLASNLFLQKASTYCDEIVVDPTWERYVTLSFTDPQSELAYNPELDDLFKKMKQWSKNGFNRVLDGRRSGPFSYDVVIDRSQIADVVSLVNNRYLSGFLANKVENSKLKEVKEKLSDQTNSLWLDQYHSDSLAILTGHKEYFLVMVSCEGSPQGYIMVHYFAGLKKALTSCICVNAEHLRSGLIPNLHQYAIYYLLKFYPGELVSVDFDKNTTLDGIDFAAYKPRMMRGVVKDLCYKIKAT